MAVNDSATKLKSSPRKDELVTSAPWIMALKSMISDDGFLRHKLQIKVLLLAFSNHRSITLCSIASFREYSEHETSFLIITGLNKPNKSDYCFVLIMYILVNKIVCNNDNYSQTHVVHEIKTTSWLILFKKFLTSFSYIDKALKIWLDKHFQLLRFSFAFAASLLLATCGWGGPKGLATSTTMVRARMSYLFKQFHDHQHSKDFIKSITYHARL